jgi:hypothetical protein
VTGDPTARLREAAQAILQARLSEQALNSTAQLRKTIDDYQKESGRQTKMLLWLTWVIAALTAVQIWFPGLGTFAVKFRPHSDIPQDSNID